MDRWLGKRGVAIVGLIVGVAGAVAQAPDALGSGASAVAAQVAQVLGVLLAAIGGPVHVKSEE